MTSPVNGTSPCVSSSMRQSASSPGIRNMLSEERHPRTSSRQLSVTVSGRNNYAYLDDELMEQMEGETEGLHRVVCRAAKYGSISSHSSSSVFPPNQRFITHQVQPHDTLQGLALRYSVTMEQIRRANRMFPSDSLFCKSDLNIPVPTSASEELSTPGEDSGRLTKSSTFLDPDEIEVVVEDPSKVSSPSTSSSNCNAKNRSAVKPTKVNKHHYNSSVSKSTSKSQQQSNYQSHPLSQDEEESCYQSGMSRSQSEFSSWTNSVTSPVGQADAMSISSDPSSISLSTLNGSRNSSTRNSRTSIRRMQDIESIEGVKEESATDFLSRIDSSIKKTKLQVAKNQKSLLPYSQSHNDLFEEGPSTSRSRDNGWKTYASLDGTNGSNSEVPTCYIKAKENKVRYSMRRLEQQQDELFQL